MAKHEHLSVYKKAYTSLKESVITSRKMPRDIRYTLGAKLIENSQHLVEEIVSANDMRQDAARKEFIESAIKISNRQLLVLRAIHDLRAISLKRYALCSELMVSVAKELGAWRRSTIKKMGLKKGGALVDKEGQTRTVVSSPESSLHGGLSEHA